MEDVIVYIEGMFVYALSGTILYKAMTGSSFQCIGDTDVGYPENIPEYIVAEAQKAARSSSIVRTPQIELKVYGEVVYSG